MADAQLSGYFRLWIRGIELNEYQMSLIESVSLEDNASGSDLLVIEISDPDMVFIEDSFFVEDVQVKFEGGFVGKENEAKKFEGYIAVLDPDFPEDNSPVKLTIHCMDGSHLMNREKKKRTWKDTTISSVAQAIFKEAHLVPVVDSTKLVEKTVSQSNQTDIDFLVSKARDQFDPEFICYVEGNKGYFVKKDYKATPQMSLGYRAASEGSDGELYGFRPRVNKETKPNKTDKNDIDSATKADNNDKTSAQKQAATNYDALVKEDPTKWGIDKWR